MGERMLPVTSASVMTIRVATAPSGARAAPADGLLKHRRRPSLSVSLEGRADRCAGTVAEQRSGFEFVPGGREWAGGGHERSVSFSGVLVAKRGPNGRCRRFAERDSESGGSAVECRWRGLASSGYPDS